MPKYILPTMGEVEVINIMADGSICDDLTGYFDTHEMPELTKHLIGHMMANYRKKQNILRNQQKQALATADAETREVHSENTKEI